MSGRRRRDDPFQRRADMRLAAASALASAMATSAVWVALCWGWPL